MRISCNPAITRVLLNFRGKVDTGEAAFLVGAGVSIDPPACRPLAGTVIDGVIKALYDTGDCAKTRFSSSNEILDLMKAPGHFLRFEGLMQILLDTMDNLDILKRLIRGGHPNRLHRLMARAVKLGNIVSTTNFDRLIERAAQRNKDFKTIVSEKECQSVRRERSGSGGYLFKLHGSIERPDTIKATLRQVGNSGLAMMWEPEKGKLFESVVKNRALIVLGYSGLDDFDIVPKLAITMSKKPVLWVQHVNSPHEMKLIPASKRRNYVSKEVDQFLRQRQASLMIGNTRVIADDLISLVTRNHGLRHKELKYPTAAAPESLIRGIIARWKEQNLGIADFMLARILAECDWAEHSQALYESSVAEFVDAQDPQNLARALLNIAQTKHLLGDLAGAIAKQKEALSLLRQIDDFSALADGLVNLAVLQTREGQGKAALKTLREAEQVSKKASLMRQLARCRATRASFLWSSENWKTAKAQARSAYRIYKKLGDLSGCAYVFDVQAKIAFIYEKDSQTAEALFKMALDIYERLGDTEQEAKTWNNLGGLYRKAGSFDLADKAYRKAKKLGRQSESKEAIIVAEIGRVALSLDKGEPEKAMRSARGGAYPPLEDSD